jgi:hypothetical protein
VWVRRWVTKSPLPTERCGRFSLFFWALSLMGLPLKKDDPPTANSAQLHSNPVFYDTGYSPSDSELPFCSGVENQNRSKNERQTAFSPAKSLWLRDHPHSAGVAPLGNSWIC